MNGRFRNKRERYSKFFLTNINTFLTVAHKCHGKTKQPRQNKKATTKQKIQSKTKSHEKAKTMTTQNSHGKINSHGKTKKSQQKFSVTILNTFPFTIKNQAIKKNVRIIVSQIIIYLIFQFNRDLNCVCLVYMFSLRFSGSKFLS